MGTGRPDELPSDSTAAAMRSLRDVGGAIHRDAAFLQPTAPALSAHSHIKRCGTRYRSSARDGSECDAVLVVSPASRAAQRRLAARGVSFLARLSRRQGNLQTLHPPDDLQRDSSADRTTTQLQMQRVDPIHRRIIHRDDHIP